MAVIRRSIAESRPDVVREVYRLLAESRRQVTLPGDLDDPLRFGVAATRGSIEQLVAYAIQQDLITRRFTADELYADAMDILGPAAA
jgi:4,5-dihydroxyphthalate decarboxylase